MKLDGIEGLKPEQVTAIMELHAADVAGLKKNHNELLADVKKVSDAKKAQDEQGRKDRETADADKLQNATSLDEVKRLLADERKSRTELEQRILDGEKERVETSNKQTVGKFVDKFVNENVVNDSLIRDAITTKISDRLGVRDGNIVEINGSELTGKTGDQVLSEIRADKGHSNHLIANNAKGGGATGGKGGDGGAVTKSISRDQYNNMPPLEASKHFKDGGTVTD